MFLPIIILILTFTSTVSPILVDKIRHIQSTAIDRMLQQEKFEKFLPEMHPDARLTTLELVNKHNYNGELHRVTTFDGYILEMHRITGRINSNTTAQKPVALVMHGLQCSSVVWIIAGPEKGLGYILTDAGYDVWLGNARGNFYSRKHTRPSIPDKEYWDFSWHEMGTRDLPAMIDYILKTTGREKLFYLGHSQATTAFFVMATVMPEYQKKIQAMFAMAPVAYCGGVISPIIQFIARFTADSIDLIMKLIGQYEFKPSSEFMKRIQGIICAENAITEPFCSNLIFLIAGFNKDQFNKTLVPIILGHIPDSISTKQLMHYVQLLKSGSLIYSGQFRQYDYGYIGNWKKYQSFRPPKYDLKKIKVPVSLHYSSNDWLSNVMDVHKLYKELGNPFGKFLVPLERFNHLDFMWAIDVKKLLYDKIISLMTHF